MPVRAATISWLAWIWKMAGGTKQHRAEQGSELQAGRKVTARPAEAATVALGAGRTSEKRPRPRKEVDGRRGRALACPRATAPHFGPSPALRSAGQAAEGVGGVIQWHSLHRRAQPPV